MFCTNCGNQMDDKANFCPNCGATSRPAAAAPNAGEAPRPLLRSIDNKWIGGVCSGFARYLNIDITLVRLLWVMSIILAGTGVLVYIVCWIVIPAEPLAAYGSSGFRAPSNR